MRFKALLIQKKIKIWIEMYVPIKSMINICRIIVLQVDKDNNQDLIGAPALTRL